MAKYLFGDIVKEIKEKVDRSNNPYEYYIAGEHMDTDELHLLRRGCFEGSDVGPAFIRIFKLGQILYGSRRTYLRKVAVADFEGVTANTTFVLESKDESILLQRLLPFIMQSDRFVQHSIKRSKGSTNPYVLFSDLADYEVELPSIEKQKELADLLWAMDSVKMSYKKLIAATDELVKSQFIEMFGYPESNSKALPTEQLGDLAFVTKLAGFEYTKYIQYQEKGDIIMIRGLNCKAGKLVLDDIYWINKDVSDLLPRSKLAKGDIVLTYVGTVGEVAVIDKDDTYHLAPNVAKISLLDKCKNDPLFWNYMLMISKDYILRFASTTTQSSLSMEKIRKIPFIVPDTGEQKKFVELLKQSDKSKYKASQVMRLKIRP
jgi:type I restriction enzyme, S subunit